LSYRANYNQPPDAPAHPGASAEWPMRLPAALAFAAVFASLCAAPAQADIYQTTADDGGLTLSNLPGARREVLIPEASAAVSPPPAGAAVPAPSDGAGGPRRIDAYGGAAARAAGGPVDREPTPGAHVASTGAGRADPAASVHFAPGAPGAPPVSGPPIAAQASAPPDRKAAESGWPRLAGETPPVRPMPVAPALLPSWAMLAPPGGAPEGNLPAPGAPPRAAVPDTQASQPVQDGGAGLATEDIVAAVALQHELDPALLHAIVTVESAYNVRALSPKGAAGLMQVLPETARRYGISDLFDPVQNLTAGARYLRDLLALFKQDLALALAAYNAGENAVIRHGNVIPPYPETQSYVPRVLATYRAYVRFFAHRRQHG
jgi:soluble lytic murein transglycosylase-like protein